MSSQAVERARESALEATGTTPASGVRVGGRVRHRHFQRRLPVLYYAVVFLIIALIAALFGFGGIAAGAAGIAKILFVVFLIVAIVTFLLSLGRR
jgi:uncharacterized membrane protein YtjA (UPF0391 family)